MAAMTYRALLALAGRIPAPHTLPRRTPITAIHRPANGKLRVRLPFSLGNRRWLRKALGAGVHLEWDGPQKVWLIARAHLWKLADAMAVEYGIVDIYIDSRGLEKCDIRCVEATGDECVCQCLGTNHGGLRDRTAGWVEVGDTTLIRSTGEHRRHLRLTRETVLAKAEEGAEPPCVYADPDNPYGQADKESMNS